MPPKEKKASSPENTATSGGATASSPDSTAGKKRSRIREFSSDESDDTDVFSSDESDDTYGELIYLDELDLWDFMEWLRKERLRKDFRERFGKDVLDFRERRREAKREFMEFMQRFEKIPFEIRKMDKEAVEIFATAVKRGTYHSYHIRIMFVGHSGAGKTTLAIGILPGRTDVTFITSTDGIDIFNEQCFFDSENNEWLEEVLGFKAFSASRLLSDCVRDDKDDLPLRNADTKRKNILTTSKQVSVASTSNETDNIEESFPNANEKSGEDLLRRVVDEYKKQGIDNERFVPVDIWDFGGQSIYYTTHQTFLTDRSIYILPVNVSLPFEHRLGDTLMGPSCPEKSSIKAFMSFWISSITTYANSEDTGYPKIIIVGTHLDKVPEDKRKESIQKAIAFIHENYKDEVESSQLVIDERLFLDARNKEDHGYFALRETIIEVAKRQKQWGEELPKSWLPFQEKILDEKKTGRKILTTDDLKQMNDGCLTPVNAEEISVILQYLHSVGLVLYFNDPGLREKVILDPKWIIDILKSFITDKAFCKPDTVQTWEKMSKKGIIEDSTIEQLWNKPEFELLGQNKIYLLKALENLDLISKPKSYNNKGEIASESFYYVPSMLNEIAPNEPSFSLKGVNINFRFSKILPLAVYNRLTAACLVMWTAEENSLYFGFSIFKVDLFHDLALKKDAETICACVSNTRGVKANTDVCSGIQTFLESTLDRIVNLYQSTSSTAQSGNRKVYTVEREQLEEDQSTADESYCPDTCEGLPGEELDKQPTDCELYRLSCQLPYNCFRDVGIQLNVDYLKREKIENPHTQITDRYFNLFRLWKNKQGKKATLRRLIHAFSQISEIGDHEHLICRIHRISETIDEDELPSDVKDRVPSDKILDGIAIIMCENYLQVAMEIGVNYHELKEIEANNKRDVVTAIRKILLTWKTNSTIRPTAEILAKALKMSDCDYSLFCQSMVAEYI